ncbi:hypothetical protein QTP88_024177 [Uroleucon formosanum]
MYDSQAVTFTSVLESAAASTMGEKLPPPLCQANFSIILKTIIFIAVISALVINNSIGVWNNFRNANFCRIWVRNIFDSMIIYQNIKYQCTATDIIHLLVALYCLVMLLFNVKCKNFYCFLNCSITRITYHFWPRKVSTDIVDGAGVVHKLTEIIAGTSSGSPKAQNSSNSVSKAVVSDVGYDTEILDVEIETSSMIVLPSTVKTRHRACSL